MRYRTYDIKQGDTLQRIAQEVLGDMSMWQSIAQYNNLKYPYVVDDITNYDNLGNNKHLAYVGDSIIIPLLGNSDDISQLALRKQDKDVIISYSLGRDLAILDMVDTAYKTRNSTDEIFNLSSNNRDLRTTYGNDNLIQAIVARISTKKGTLPLHPEYGSTHHDFIGQRVTYDLINKLQVAIRTVVNQEPRVKDNSVKITSDNGVDFTVTLHVNPIDSDEQLDIMLELLGSGSVILK